MITAFRLHGDPAGYSPVIRVGCLSTLAPTAPFCILTSMGSRRSHTRHGAD